MKKFFEEFKAFAMRGNVLDMAVGVVIGGAFGKITTSLVGDIIMPLISMLTGGVDFSAWKWVLKEAVMEGAEVVTPEVAVNYGSLIAVILDFIIIAIVVFCMVKSINRMHEKLSTPAAPAPERPAMPLKKPAPEELNFSDVYTLPPVNLLNPVQKKLTQADIDNEIDRNSRKLVEALQSFGVQTKLVGVSRGPSVTRYELKTAPGVKIS